MVIKAISELKFLNIKHASGIGIVGKMICNQYKLCCSISSGPEASDERLPTPLSGTAAETQLQLLLSGHSTHLSYNYYKLIKVLQQSALIALYYTAIAVTIVTDSN